MADITTEAQIDQAFESARNSPESIVADHVQLDFALRLLLIHLSNGRRLVLPLEDIQKLGEATSEQLEDYDLLSDGYAIEWPQLDISFRIEGLIEGAYGNKRWMQELHRRREATRPSTETISHVETKTGKSKRRKTAAA